MNEFYLPLGGLNLDYGEPEVLGAVWGCVLLLTFSYVSQVNCLAPQVSQIGEQARGGQVGLNSDSLSCVGRV